MSAEKTLTVCGVVMRKSDVEREIRWLTEAGHTFAGAALRVLAYEYFREKEENKTR